MRGAIRTEPFIATLSGDGLLIALLALLNESSDLDATLERGLELMTTALAGRIGEIWLRSGDGRGVELRYSASDRSSRASAFEAAGRGFGVGAGPPVVGHVLRTGRRAIVERVAAHAWGDRDREAAALHIHGAVAFPMRTSAGIVGVLVVLRESVNRPV